MGLWVKYFLYIGAPCAYYPLSFFNSWLFFSGSTFWFPMASLPSENAEAIAQEIVLQ